MNHGEKIAALRKESGMTQAELGRELNVSFQAVSKWERSESSPDFATMSRIAKLFDVPLSYFEDESDGDNEALTEDSTSDDQTQDDEQPDKKMIGVCTKCGKVVYEGDEYATTPFVKCDECRQREIIEEQRAADAKRESEKQAREIEESQRKYRAAAIIKKRNRGLIWAAVIVGVFELIAVISIFINPSNVGMAILGAIALGIFMYAYFAQVFWGGKIIDISFFAVTVFGGWGVLFTFDLDGFIFLIVMKIIMWLLKIFIVIITFLFSFAVAFFISPFMFVPQMRKLMRGEELR